MMGFQISGSAQSFNWLNGGTGRSMGSGVTVDSWNRTYVVGAFAPNLSNQFGLAPGLVPSFTLGAEDHVAYLSRYNTSNGNPELVSVISLSSNGQFCNTGTAGYVMADRVAVASNGQIYVLGVFKGCNLDLHDSQGNSIITTNSSFDSRYFQKVFVAVYDSSFRPLSCHILYGFNNGFDYFSGDIKRGYRPSQDPDVMEEKIFFAASVIGEQALVETFGTLPSSHSTAFNPITIPDQAAYDIYLGQIDVAANGIDHAVIIGGDGDDHPSALASGYLGLPEFSDHLYLTGAFHGNISFNHPASGLQTFTSNGRSDLFTCRFLAFDLNSQEAVVAGGPWDDQALAITDNGRYVGGAISESAQFGGTFTFTPTLGALTACTGYLPGDRKEVGFIARADYASQTWASVDSIFEMDEDTQVMTMASARCDDFYAVVSQGIHPDRIRVPYLNYDHGCFTGSGSCHNYFSTITKWHDQGTQAALLWEHSFVPPNPITYPVAATRYIEDMEYVFDNSGMGVPDLSSNYYNDVLFTGRFGDFIEVPLVDIGNNMFDGNVGGSYTHDIVGMFVSSMKQSPSIELDTLTICITDTIVLPVILDSIWWTGANPQVDTSTLFYTGFGIIDSLNWIFAAPGYGTYPVSAHYEYLNCEQEDIAFVINVVPDDYVIHPIVAGTSWSEGMAVESWPANATDNPNPWDIVFNAGRYEGSISFEKFDNTMITLNSNAGVPSGYIVAYGPCGALWATNFQCGSTGIGGYVEGLVMEKTGTSLYAVGGLDDDVTFINSNNLIGPTMTTNGQTIATNAVEKGFVAKLNASTGQVKWIYYGSDNAAHTNRFHGVDLYREYLVARGEFQSDFVDNASFYTLASQNVTDYDVVTVVIDTSGTDIDAAAIGALYDDHGDAVSLYPEGENTGDWKVHIVGISDIQGGVSGLNNIAPIFPTTIGSSLITAAYGTDVLIDHYYFACGAGLLVPDQWRVFNGNGDDHGMDVEIMGIKDFSGLYPNEIVYSGSFTSEIDTSIAGVGNMMPATGGIGSVDGFIGTVDINLTQIGWFNREGSALGQNESVDALEYLDGSVYAVGKFERTPMVNLLNAGGLSMPNPGYTGLFTLQFQPNGTFINASQADPNNSGVNQHTDVAAIDTSLITTGWMDVLFAADYITFHTNNLNGTITSNAGNQEAFIARFDATDNAFFKRSYDEIMDLDKSEVLLYPNPNEGSFTLNFGSELSGDLTVYNAMGQSVFKQRFAKTNRMDVEIPQPPGIYVFKLLINEERVYGKFVIQ